MIPPVARRFIAGETVAEALDHARRLDARGRGTILNLLGEHYDRRDPAADDAATYRQLVADIDAMGVRACISVKPSQLGLDVGEDVFRANYRSVVEAAREHDVFVWCDMEDRSTTDATLDAFVDVARESGPAGGGTAVSHADAGVGLCVQANLHRTGEDLERLADVPGKVRLVKGAYDEPPEAAHQTHAAVNEAYRDHLRYLFETFDGGVAVGSHDPEMIELADRLHDEYGTDYEVQMLMGVREQAQRDLTAAGREVWQYAPFGGKWLSYSYRRVRERRENLLFALRAVLGR